MARRQSGLPDPQQELEIAHQRFSKLYDAAMKDGNLKLALSAQKELLALRRVLPQQDDHEQQKIREQEWTAWTFRGGVRVAAKKRAVLVALEEYGAPYPACRAVGTPRRTYDDWIEKDDEFFAAVAQVIEFCVQRAESDMYRDGTLYDRSGKRNTSARFGFLNAKADEWGLMKAQLIRRANAKFLDEAAVIIREEANEATSDKILDRLGALLDRASALPPGASLK